MDPITLKRRAVIALAAVTTAFGAAAASAQTVLRYSNWLPEGYPVRTRIIEPWIADVQRVTQGRVRIETAPKVVGTVAGQYDVVRDGLADIALIVPGYTPTRFELTELFELPFLGESLEARSPASWRVYQQELARYGEFKDVHVVGVFMAAVGQFYTSKKELRTLEDFKGVKLRSPNPATSQAITLLGAVPISKPVPEIYELATGGVIDGGVIVAETIVGFKLQDVLKKVSIVPGGMSASTLLVAMNKTKWESLSKADQEAISKLSGEALARLAGRVTDESERESFARITAAGATVHRFDAASVAQLRTRLAPVEQAWFDKARKKGVAEPERLVERLRAEIATARPKP